MRRPLLITLLTLGVIGGYGSSIARAVHHRGKSCDRASWAAAATSDEERPRTPPCGHRPKP